MDKEKLEKIREVFPYVDMCLEKKTGNVCISVDLLYELIFKNV